MKTVKRLLLPLLSAATIVASSAASRPNFLLMISDDLTWRDLGYEGINKDIHTPNLDKLRSESMHFTRMFNAATTCSPTRHALYGGLHSIRSGAYPNHTRFNPGIKSVFTYLKDAGYRVALQNKEHVGPKESFPYEHIEGADDLTETEKFVRRDPDQPWMMVYASNDPHGPWTRGPKHLYDPKKITVPPYLHDNATTRAQLVAYYAEISMFDQQVGNLMKLLDATGQAENTLVIYVSEQGSSFPYGGKWGVHDNGIRASTIVRWPGKVKPGSTSDVLVQYVDVTPTFLEAAGIDPTKIDTGSTDANGYRGFDGRSFLKVLTSQQATFREYVFAQHTTVGINGYLDPYPMRAVRDTRYKLIRNLAPGNTYTIGGIHKGEPITSWQEDARTNPQLAARVDFLFHRPAEELYDIQSDEHEMQNLAADPRYAEIKARLSRELDQWMAQQGDKGLVTENEALAHQPRNEKPEAPAKKSEPKNKKKTKKGAVK